MGKLRMIELILDPNGETPDDRVDRFSGFTVFCPAGGFGLENYQISRRYSGARYMPSPSLVP